MTIRPVLEIVPMHVRPWYLPGTYAGISHADPRALSFGGHHS